jgi:hypothetical protein
MFGGLQDEFPEMCIEAFFATGGIQYSFRRFWMYSIRVGTELPITASGFGFRWSPHG